MNPRLELYRSGGSLVVRRIFGKAGRRTVVIDRALRARQAAVRMAGAGADVATIARTLHRSRAFVRRAVAKKIGPYPTFLLPKLD
jgi:hypothetical protein